MAETDWLEQQRQIVRAFRQATAERAKNEVAAEAQYRASQQAADTDLAAVRQQAAAHLAEAQRFQDMGHAALREAGLEDLLDQVETVETVETVSRDGDDPARWLADAVARAGESVAALERAIDDLERLRAAMALRRRVVAILTLVAVVVVAFLAHQGYQTWRKDGYYGRALAALDAGQWETVRSEITALRQLDYRYRFTDVQTLLRQSYYRPSVAALDDGQWEMARTEIQALLNVDNSNYKDAYTLIQESYYRPAVAAFDARQWDDARAELQELLNRYGDYKDASTLLRESYYVPAMAALEAGQWEAARDELQQLISIDGGYKGVQQLLRESYYRPGVAALDAGQWEHAQAQFSLLASIDDGYRDVSILRLESFYRPLVIAIGAEQWDSAAQFIMQLNRLDPTYRDTPDFADTHPEIYKILITRYSERWLAGAATRAQIFDSTGSSTAFSPDSKLLAVPMNDSMTVNIWDVATGQLLQTLSIRATHRYGIHVAFSPDGAILAAGGSGEIILWDISNAVPIRTMPAPTLGVQALAFSPNGRWFAWASTGFNSPFLWLQDMTTLEEQFVHLGNMIYAPRSIVFSPDSRTLISVAEATERLTIYGVVDFWNPTDLSRVHSIHTGRIRETSGDLSPDGATLASAGGDGSIILWDTSNYQAIHRLIDGAADGNGTRVVAFSPDGRILVSDSPDGKVVFWDANSRQMIRALSQIDYMRDITDVTFSPNGRLLAVAGNGNVVVWQVN